MTRLIRSRRAWLAAAAATASSPLWLAVDGMVRSELRRGELHEPPGPLLPIPEKEPEGAICADIYNFSMRVPSLPEGERFQVRTRVDRWIGRVNGVVMMGDPVLRLQVTRHDKDGKLLETLCEDVDRSGDGSLIVKRLDQLEEDYPGFRSRFTYELLRTIADLSKEAEPLRRPDDVHDV